MAPQLEGYDANSVLSWMEEIYVTTVLTAFKSICADEMGKTAIAEKLSKITIDPTDGSSVSSWSFENGELRIVHKPCTNVDILDERSRDLQALLESKL